MSKTTRTTDLDTAATLLNIKKDTLRKQLQRGKIAGIKDRSGKWQVVIDDETEPAQDTEQDKQDKQQDNQDNRLIEQLQSTVDYLRQENYRKDSIIMELTKRVPLLEAPKQNHVPWYRKLFNRGGDDI